MSFLDRMFNAAGKAAQHWPSRDCSGYDSDGQPWMQPLGEIEEITRYKCRAPGCGRTRKVRDPLMCGTGLRVRYEGKSGR